jgi:hypothetical protein
MPAKPSYAHRIPAAIQALENSRDEWIDRRRLEEGLGLSKTVAWRLLRRLGAREGPGNTLCLSRLEAIEGLKRLQQEGGPVDLEIRRRARVEHYLESMRGFVAAQRTTIADKERAIDLVNTRFQNLPRNVLLTSRTLHIEFNSTADFLKSFGAIVFALNNDYEAVREFIDGAG